MYPVNSWTNSNEYRVDVYSDSTIKHYKMYGETGNLSFIDEEPHYFSQCPANIFYLPDEKSIFDCIMPLQDAANELLSSEIDDYTAFCDAYLALTGADADKEEIIAMKEDRVIILPEGATAHWITKNSNDTQVENILKRIHDSIYRISSCVDFSNESFTGGVTSGVAIRFKLSGMEVRAGKIEALMKKALQRRIEIICGIASLKLGEAFFMDIDINFTRNIPQDITATTNLINTLKGTVSDKTLLAQLPFIENVEEELEAVQEQKEANMQLFNFNTGEDEDV
jgi:SPP1 family phage portal protein